MGLAHEPFGWRLGSRERHIAHLLGEVGYATWLVGMQHLIERGQAEDLGYSKVLPVAPAREESAAAIECLRSLKEDGRPFYLEVGFEEPHRPYDFGGAHPDSSLGVEVPPYLPDVPEARDDFAAFQGAVRGMDEAVGAILAALDDLDLAHDTWVIFTADHGIAMPRAKGTLYDPGIEVALLMRWPGGGLKGGMVVDELVSNVDVVPTLLEGLRLPLPGNLQGRSLWPLLMGEGYSPRTEIFAEKTFHTYYEPMRCVRTDTHKFIVNLEVSTAVDVPADVRQSPVYPMLMRSFGHTREHVELYDLWADPWERKNLAGQHGLGPTEAALSEKLWAWMEETQDPLLDGPVASPYYRESLGRLRSGKSSPAG
jgi:arylsulfatase A-like enzyme